MMAKLFFNKFSYPRTFLMSIIDSHCLPFIKMGSKLNVQICSFHRTTRKVCRVARKTHGKSSRKIKFTAIMTAAIVTPSAGTLISATNSKFLSSVNTLIVSKKPRKQNILLRLLANLWMLVRISMRALRFIVTFTPLVILYPLIYCGASSKQFYLNLLIIAVEYSGPTMLKLGQWASTRRDLFSVEFCETFSRLQRKVEPHSWYFTKQRLERAFGPNWKKIFVKFDNHRQPVGSGCIAQIYKAYIPSDLVLDDSILADIEESFEPEPFEIDFSEGAEILGLGAMLSADETELEDSVESSKNKDTAEHGTAAEADRVSVNKDSAEDLAGLVPVAVKVLHPGIYSTICTDLTLLRCVTKVAEFLLPSLRWVSLSECVEEFSQLMLNQIDLRIEADNLEKFWAIFEQNPNVRVPRPIRPYVKSHVLVEQFEEGKPINNFLSVDDDVKSEYAGLKEKLAEYGVNALMQMVFVDNFVHGDLHPGNIIVQNSELYSSTQEQKLMLVDMCDTVLVNVKHVDSPVRLVLFDCGITASLSETDLANLKSVFAAVADGDGETVAKLLLDKSRSHCCTDEASYVKEMAAIVTQARDQTIQLGKMRVSDLLSNVLNCLVVHKVKLESNFASVILAIMVLEGLGRSLNPDLDILEAAKPFLINNI